MEIVFKFVIKNKRKRTITRTRNGATKMRSKPKLLDYDKIIPLLLILRLVTCEFEFN